MICCYKGRDSSSGQERDHVESERRLVQRQMKKVRKIPVTSAGGRHGYGMVYPNVNHWAMTGPFGCKPKNSGENPPNHPF